jgi:hypothetical protein
MPMTELASQPRLVIRGTVGDESTFVAEDGNFEEWECLEGVSVHIDHRDPIQTNRHGDFGVKEISPKVGGVVVTFSKAGYLAKTVEFKVNPQTQYQEFNLVVLLRK